MKRFLIIISALFIIISPSFSVEWGGVFNNDSQGMLFEKDELGFTQSNAVNLWVRTPVSKSNKWNLSTELQYRYKLKAIPKSIDFLNILDLSLLKMSGSFDIAKNKVGISLGRFTISDSTFKIFNCKSDGAFFEFDFQRVLIDIYAGFTGLTNHLNNAGFLDSEGNLQSLEGDLYVFEKPYVPVILQIELPSLFANQSLSIQAFAAFDCSDVSNNKYYGTVDFSGPILASLFYKFSTTFGSQSFNNLMNYSSFLLMLFPNKFLSANFGVEYASGNQLIFSNFRTVSSYSLSDIATIELTNSIIPSVGVGFTFGNLYAKFDVKCGLEFVNNSISFNKVFGKLITYYNVFSDFQLGLDVNALLNVENSFDNAFSVSLKGAFVF